jgi:hypothetical protein
VSFLVVYYVGFGVPQLLTVRRIVSFGRKDAESFITSRIFEFASRDKR